MCLFYVFFMMSKGILKMRMRDVGMEWFFFIIVCWNLCEKKKKKKYCILGVFEGFKDGKCEGFDVDEGLFVMKVNEV